MLLKLKFNNHSKDTFLHLNPSIYRKILLAKTGDFFPIVQLQVPDIGLQCFWGVEDETVLENQASLNSLYSKSLGLKPESSVELSLFDGHGIDLRKLIVTIIGDEADWEFLHENYHLFEDAILSQCRTVTKGQDFPISLSSRKTPLWFNVLEFGGYQSSSCLGILHPNTELIVVERDSSSEQRNNHSVCQEVSLRFLPSQQLAFAINPVHFINVEEPLSIGNHFIDVKFDEGVPAGFLQVPAIILEKVFKLLPKSFLKLVVKPFSSDFTYVKYYTSQKQFSANNPLPVRRTTISEIEHGLAVYHNDFIHDKQVFYSEPTCPKPVCDLECLALNLMGDSKRCILFHGVVGNGKSARLKDLVSQLNYSPHFALPILCIDMNELEHPTMADQMKMDQAHLIIFDHFDEHFELDSDDSSIKSNLKFTRFYRKISSFLHIPTFKFIFVCRSARNLSKFLSICPIPFDFVYSSNENTPSPPLKPAATEWNDVFARNEAKRELERHILHPIRYSELFKANGLKLHGSVLLSGPSGAGKTYLAESFLRHYGLASIHVRGPEILDKYVGSSEAAVRNLFVQAKSKRPCVLFFDEIDSLVPMRGSNHSGVTDRIVNQFLTELDGTEDRSGIFVLATSGRPDLIDPAILRPGRIDQHIRLDYPVAFELRQALQSFNVKGSLIKTLVKFVKLNPEIKINWADICSVNWNEINDKDSLDNFLSSLRANFVVDCRQTASNVQRLSLA